MSFRRFVVLSFITLALQFVTVKATDSTQNNDSNEKNNIYIANQHFQNGNNAYAIMELVEAKKEYEKCLDIELSTPPLHGCLINLASVLLDLGEEMDRAEALYREALKLNPKDGDAAFNLAMLLQDSKTIETSREAAALYEISVQADPTRWDAWSNMAAALSDVKEEHTKAMYAFEQAILLIEGMSIDTYDESSVRERDSYLSKLYYGYGMTLSELTSDACDTVITDSPNLVLIIKTQTEQDDDKEEREMCTKNAQNMLRQATALDPNNYLAAHMLVALSSNDNQEGSSSHIDRAKPEFVEALFDDFADTFDDKLLKDLDYRVPQLIGNAVSSAAAKNSKNRKKHGGKGAFNLALDAGCGTGLAGRYLRPYVKESLIGVDLSQKMLKIAQGCTMISGCGMNEHNTIAEKDIDNPTKPLYDGLLAMDLETMGADNDHELFLKRTVGGEAFDLIVAADVLVYFGKLDTIIENFSKLSKVGATLIFSCERLETQKKSKTNDPSEIGDWKLTPSGRFAHAKEYVIRVATNVGYELVTYEEIIPRVEKGVPVKGHLFNFVLSDKPSLHSEL